MPTCPGCYRHVSHQRLPIHSQYCPDVLANTRDAEFQARSMEQLHRTVAKAEGRIESRIEKLERLLADLKSEQSGRLRRE